MITTKEEQEAFIAKIEQDLRDRLKLFKLEPGKPKAMDEEAAFLSGAMSVLNLLLPHQSPGKISPIIPTRWIYARICGDSVIGKA